MIDDFHFSHHLENQQIECNSAPPALNLRLTFLNNCCSRPYRAKKYFHNNTFHELLQWESPCPRATPCECHVLARHGMGLPQGCGGYSATPFVHKISFKQSPNIFSAGLAERALFLCPNAVPTFLYFIWGTSIQRQGSVFRPAPLP